MAGVVLSLISVGAFIVGGAAVAMATLLRAHSRALRRHRQLSELNLTGIDEIDEALDRILAQEHGASWLA
jgi:membrane protein required for beta-lactamase induction